MFKNKILIIPILLLFILSIGIVSASENTNKPITQEKDSNNNIILDNTHNSNNKININLKNKKITKTSKTHKKKGKSSTTKKNSEIIIKTKNFKTYLDSDIFFTAKILNKTNKQQIKNKKVLFRVYKNKNKYFDYSTITNKKGIARLNKNLKIGNYKVYTYIKNNNITTKNSKKLKIKATSEMGCCSFYIHLNSSESIAGFRRDSTYAANILIKKSKWNNRTIIKQYKTAHTYFFHLITSSDGWMMGTGGADNPNINKKIEKLSETMVSLGKIKQNLLKKIQSYEKILGIGHYSIKDPKGNYAVVWKNRIKTGKLKEGEYISVPNKLSYFRYGKFKKFDKNPLKAAIKIGATDLFGTNRRDCTIFHLKYSESNGTVSAYAANDNGKLSGRRTSRLKDNIYFKNKYFSKNSLPNIPKMKLLGTYTFKNYKTYKNSNKINT